MHKATLGLAALLLIGTVGCVDLEVQNPNAPDTERALADPANVESLIRGGMTSWHYVLWYDGGPTGFLSATAFEHGAPWANMGVEQYARIPRIPMNNDPGDPEITYLTAAWENSYAAINQVAAGMFAIKEGLVDMGADELRAQAFGKFIQGLAHGSVALLYDSGFVFDEDTECLADGTCGSDPADVPLRPYGEVMARALLSLDEAATLAASGSFTIPATWIGEATSSARLAEIARAERARIRAAVARTPAERAAVDWTTVASDAAALTADWNFVTDCVTLCDEALGYRNRDGWVMHPMWIIGMADQSGEYQSWIGTATADKREFVMQTPDTRFPQGATQAAQEAAPGTFFEFATGGNNLVGRRPDRGTWRWGNYRFVSASAMPTGREIFNDYGNNFEGSIPMWTVREMKGLIAEAGWRGAGGDAALVTFINETRPTHGLSATDVGGTNTECVPKLPNNSCGNLWEMFKWEKRLETQQQGPMRIGWYFDGRGWGDLMEGTTLMLPVPFREMQLLEQTPYNLGGVGNPTGAPVGNYGY
jgi:hypothetical protein